MNDPADTDEATGMSPDDAERSHSARTLADLGERYHCIARRRGTAKAQVAVARSILVIISLAPARRPRRPVHRPRPPARRARGQLGWVAAFGRWLGEQARTPRPRVPC